MARGDSGRIVVEIEPTDKEELYSALAREGITLKDWFLRQASHYLRERSQPSLFGASAVAEARAKYESKKGRIKPRGGSVKRKRTRK